MSQYLGDTDLRVVEARLGYLIRLWIEGGAERQRETTQLVKCFPCIPERLSLESQHSEES